MRKGSGRKRGVTISSVHDESGRRTGGDHPHLLHDNLCYVAPYGKSEKRHKAYLEQLKEYTECNPGDLFANVIYSYVKTGNILHDLKRHIAEG